MWHANSKTQLSIACVPTRYGEPRKEANEAERMLKTAGRFHLSRNFSPGSQAVAVCYTEEDCMGGRSWTTLNADEDTAKAMTLFLNSAYGMLIWVGYGQTAMKGRATLQVKAIDGLPIPDFGANTPAAKKACAIAAKNFDRLRSLTLRRVSLNALDPNRAEIDRVVALTLGLPRDIRSEAMLDSRRRLMCLQPAVNGKTKTTLRTLAAAGITA